MTAYIDTVQEDTLSSFPLMLEAQHVDTSSLLTTFIGKAQSTSDHPEDGVYDTVLMALTDSMGKMLTRNLFYTAISRARRCVQLYGSMQAVDTAMQRSPAPRRSMLVPKTRRRMAEIS